MACDLDARLNVQVYYDMYLTRVQIKKPAHVILLAIAIMAVASAASIQHANASTSEVPPPQDIVDPALIDAIQGYIDSSKSQAAQEKWTRALAGLGGASHVNPMMAQEAQINAYKFDPNRWNPVIEAMAALQGVTVDKPAALISAVQDYAAETHVGSEHVDRWNRVLAALGAGTHDNPMTVVEAQEYADRSWKRWVPVVEALTVIESQEPATDHTQRYAELITTVRGYTTETHHGPDHIERWMRVLAAFGVVQHDSPMTAVEASQMAEKYQKARWAPIAEALAQIESEASVQQELTPQQSPQQAPQDPQSEQQKPPIWNMPAQEEPGPTQNSHEPYQVPQALITTVQGYAAETQNGAEHVNRWNRVLAAFGVVQHDSPMTAAEAQGFADRFSGERWNPIVAALTALEESQQPHGMTRAEVIAEWKPKVQEMRGMSAQANSMMAEAKEFVKKWDETPAVYADAIDNAEHDLGFLEIRFVDNAYEQLKNEPTSEVHRQTLQGLYESIQNNFSALETHLETLLSTARQPTARDQCAQPGVECEWHDAPNDMTKSMYVYTASDGTKVVIKYHTGGSIQQYNEYYPDNPTQKALEINYYNPNNYRSCYDVNPRSHTNTNFQDWCRAKVQLEKAWYIDGQIAREREYRSPASGIQEQRDLKDKAYRADGTIVYDISPFGSDGSPTNGYYTYPDESKKSIYNAGSLTCYEDGAGSATGAVEPCMPFHTWPQY